MDRIYLELFDWTKAGAFEFVTNADVGGPTAGRSLVD